MQSVREWPAICLDIGSGMVGLKIRKLYEILGLKIENHKTDRTRRNDVDQQRLIIIAGKNGQGNLLVGRH